jgi:predicted small lipoprotein YifL
MRDVISVLVLAVLLAACGPKAAHEFPPEARAKFAEGCATGDPKCDCMWERITRTMTPEEFDAAMARYKEKGLMEPELTAARLECREAK